MTSSSQPRVAKYTWCDRPDIIVSYSRTINSRINAAVKIEGGYLRHVRPKAASILQIYVRKTTTINKDALRGRNVPREYETWSSLRDHPYILACEDFQWVVNKISLDEVTFWSKRCEYGDLGRFVLNEPHQTMKLSTEQAEEVVCQIISALAFIHHGLYIIVDKGGHIKELDFGDHELLIHRDIKPENIFVDHLDYSSVSHGSIRVKLGDFGCAKPLDDGTTMSDAGTNRYRAPESERSTASGGFQRPHATAKSDIWSFGATIRDITADIPDIIHSCCESDPTKRPSSVQLLELFYQEKRQNIPPLILEALRRDEDQAYWEIQHIQRLLEAGANPQTIGPERMSISSFVAGSSNKTTKEKGKILNLLSAHSPSYQITSDKPLERMVQILIKAREQEHSDKLLAFYNLASVLHSQGQSKFVEALQIMLREQNSRDFGEEHPETLESAAICATISDCSRMAHD